MISFILLNIFLVVGSYLAGCIPTAFNLSATKIRVLTLFGAGLLLGAALVVIIPEGVDTLYNAENVPIASSSGAPLVHSPDLGLKREKRDAHSVNSKPENAAVKLGVDSSGNMEVNKLKADNVHISTPGWFTSVHQKTGLALLLGYLFMLFVDQLSTPLIESPCTIWILSRLCWCGRCRRRSTGGPSTNSLPSGTAVTTNLTTGVVGGQKRSTATIGLVFHSFADGLALGAAFAVGQQQLEIILTLAILLHKVPAAFGLGCYLVHEGFSRDQIRLHLLVFAFAAPLASIVTYVYLALPSVAADNTLIAASAKRTGFALLLSGGTFLYVAASHILPELIQGQSLHTSMPDQTGADPGRSTTDYTLYTMASNDPLIVYSSPSAAASVRKTPHPHRLACLDLFVLTLGAVIPLLLTAGHVH